MNSIQALAQEHDIELTEEELEGFVSELPVVDGVQVIKVEPQRCPISHHPDQKVTYKQRWDGLWIGDNNTVLIEQGDNGYHVLVGDTIVRSIKYFFQIERDLREYFDVAEIELRSYYQIHGRDREQVISFNEGHMTPGTKFRVGSHLQDLKDEVLTVKHLQRNGPGSVVIVCEEKYPESNKTFAGENRSVNVGHVTQIIKREPGFPVFCYKEYEQDAREIKLRNHLLEEMLHTRRDEIIEASLARMKHLESKGLVYVDKFNGLANVFSREPSASYHRNEFYLDNDKIFKLMKARGWLTSVNLTKSDRYGVTHYVDPKKVLKLFRKNPALFCHSLKEMQKREKEDWDRMYAEDDDNY